MFGFKKNNHPSTIIIDGLDVIIDDQMTVSTMWQQRHVPSNLGMILAKAVDASDDSIDIALAAYIHTHGMSMPLYEPFHRIKFNRESGTSGNVWHHGSDYQVAVKGMPERIFEHCDMSENERESITMQLHAMSATGMIVIAVATGILPHGVKNLDSLKKNEKLSFVGFIGLQAEVSAEARQLILQARASHTTIFLCTGQHQFATYFLAQQLDLASTQGEVYDAEKLSVINETELDNIVTSTKIFSRCTSEQRRRIISAIKIPYTNSVTVTTLADLKKILAT